LQFAFCILQSILGRGLLASAALAAAIPLAATAGELQWRRGGAAFKASQAAIAEQQVDFFVQPAALAVDGGVRLASGAEGAQFHSVIAPPQEISEALRSAQRTEPPAATEDSQTDETENLFAPMPDEVPPLEAPQPEALDFDMPPQPEDEPLRLGPDQGQPVGQPIQGSPFEPAPLDTTMPPGPLPERIPTPAPGTIEAEREKSQETCAQGLSDLQAKTIDTLNLSIAVTGEEGSDYPFECTLEEGRWHEGRYWEQTVYLWKASALCHKPLYFEDEHLERYGHSWPPMCQPFVSGAHFFTRLPILPYCMGVEPPNECIYALGHYRPGSCAPYMCNPVPLSWRGALFQAGAVVGAAAALP
jgi:hypothetical protein